MARLDPEPPVSQPPAEEVLQGPFPSFLSHFP
jgi:hypothetical protein